MAAEGRGEAGRQVSAGVSTNCLSRLRRRQSAWQLWQELAEVLQRFSFVWQGEAGWEGCSAAQDSRGRGSGFPVGRINAKPACHDSWSFAERRTKKIKSGYGRWSQAKRCVRSTRDPTCTQSFWRTWSLLPTACSSELPCEGWRLMGVDGKRPTTAGA